ncbi:MAG: Nif3-like dinuclear metal center hexameric protein [Eubacteriales bacterium]|nr:Nif3-like dinuclear metal center hexameric protein [Eubacteriales bacterium]
MKIREVIEKVLEYHPKFPEDYAGCDTYKCGDPEAECTGIVTALVPTVEVIRKTIELGCNLLFVHEPAFYSTPDYPDWRAGFHNSVYEEKRKLLDDHGIVIWRDHDHMHAHQPDSIFTGVTKYLGWEDYAEGKAGLFAYVYNLPECTVEDLKNELIEKLHLNGLRYVGDSQSKIRKVAIVGHLCLNAFGTDHEDENGYFVEYGTEVIKLLEQEVDAIIPGEIIEWTTLSYIRDAVQLGKNKAMFNIGHFSMEELGMRYAKDWIEELVDGVVPVTYVPCGDLYRF